MIRVIINGYKGRMGRALLDCAGRLSDCSVTGQVDQGDDLEAVLSQGDVVIEFSFHNVTAGVAALCARHQKALVIGTRIAPDASPGSAFCRLPQEQAPKTSAAAQYARLHVRTGSTRKL